MRLSRNKIVRAALGVVGIALLGSSPLAAEEVLNVYSQRHYAIDEKLNAMFTAKTGIAVKVVNAEADQLIERLKSEGSNSPADVLIAVDAGRMQYAAKEGLLQPLDSEILKKAAPANLRDKDGLWHPYTIRARVILRSKERVKEGEINTYEDLAKPEWKGRLLIRSASSSYNLSLLASIIAAHGEEAAEAWAKGVVANMARPPQGGDRDQIKAVAAGLADVCVSNTYYFGLLVNSKDAADRDAAGKVAIVFPNQKDRGTHCNVSGAGVTKNAKNVKNAKAYLEFLVSPEAQTAIANGSYEYPVSMDLTLSPVHKEWGTFTPDSETFSKLEANQAKASKIFDRSGWK